MVLIDVIIYWTDLESAASLTTCLTEYQLIKVVLSGKSYIRTTSEQSECNGNGVLWQYWRECLVTNTKVSDVLSCLQYVWNMYKDVKM